MKKIRITDALAEFDRANRLKGLAPETIDYYTFFLNVFLKWLPPKIKYCAQLTYKVYQDYLLHLYDIYDNKNSINTSLRAFRRFINFCAANGWLRPFKITLVNTVSALKPTYTLEDFQQIIYDLSKQGLICLLLLSTGIRSKTLRFLKVSDFNHSDRTLFLRHLKNKSQTLLPLPEFTANRLYRYIRINNYKSNYLLFAKNDGTPYSRAGLYNLISDYLQRFGIDAGGIHKFRHTYGKYFSKAGGPSIALSHLLTHSSVEQSERYTSLYGDELRSFMAFNPVETLLKGIKKASRHKPRD